eukprot:scaffold122133_cov15-Tisochrysis_lutea.AAC.3
MSWGPSSEQELEQLLSLALLLQRHGELPSPAAHAPPRRSHSVNTSKPERPWRRVYGDADEGGSAGCGGELDNSSDGSSSSRSRNCGHTAPHATGWRRARGASAKSKGARSSAPPSPAAPAAAAAAAVAAAATTRARHGRRSGTNGRFGQAHAQQQLQASGPVRPSTTFESENESDSDQDVAASRAALRADAQRERLKQM